MEIPEGMNCRSSRHNVLLVSDFFYPGLGGVEMHIYQLGQCLMERGHKVVVMSNMYNKERVGVRYMTNGLKVYHVPVYPITNQSSPYYMHVIMSITRQIVIREDIDIVHGHQGPSSLMQHVMHIAAAMGLRTVFTDHSLFGFADASSIHLNKGLKWSLQEVDAAITVSHINKENVALRTKIAASEIFVIPNAVDTTHFTPDPSLVEPKGTVNIVVVCRMTYRKGVDLLVDIIPEIIRRHPNVHFIIGGDGPKLPLLIEMRDRYNLGERIEILGKIPHNKVRDVLC
jgi:phosphatidylinositol N-acetylglucosaminyltransferase subunit A